MDRHLRALMVDAGTAYYRIDRYPVGGPFFGPVDLGLHLSGRHNALNLGAGLLAGSPCHTCRVSTGAISTSTCSPPSRFKNSTDGVPARPTIDSRLTPKLSKTKPAPPIVET